MPLSLLEIPDELRTLRAVLPRTVREEEWIVSSPRHRTILHVKPLAPNLPVPGTIGKPRRPIGDPVSPPKQPLPFIAPPAPTKNNLKLPLNVVAPDAAQTAQKASQLVFHAAGDTGGVLGTHTQEAIAEAMEAQIKAATVASRPAFLYHLGDVVYYNGQSANYTAQFYEPYQYYPAPIFAIAGNHDGDNHPRAGDAPDSESSLYGFIQNFCSAASTAASPYRQTMTQPYVYWTLAAPFVTIIGLYSNIGGSLDPRGANEQQQWLEAQMAAVPSGNKLIIAVHHAPYSLDAVHGGSPDVLIALDRAIAASSRIPDGVLSGHVHNYQRFARKIDQKLVPYIVAGAGGYQTSLKAMHRLQQGLSAHRPFQTTHSDVQLVSDNDHDPGFLRITVTPHDITYEYFVVPFDGSAVRLHDSVTV